MIWCLEMKSASSDEGDRWGTRVLCAIEQSSSRVLCAVRASTCGEIGTSPHSAGQSRIHAYTVSLATFYARKKEKECLRSLYCFFVIVAMMSRLDQGRLIVDMITRTNKSKQQTDACNSKWKTAGEVISLLFSLFYLSHGTSPAGSLGHFHLLS